jgi:hypothetical protein
MTETNTPIEPPVHLARQKCFWMFKAVALALIIFVAGGVAGFGVARLLRRPPPPFMGPMAPEPPVGDLVDRLRNELLLSDDQVQKVREIYQQRHDALVAIRDKMGPELKSEYDKLDEQMKAVLNTAQYERWSERFRSLRERMLPPPPPGRPPGGPGGPGEFPGQSPGIPGGPEGPGGPPGNPPGGPEGMPPPPPNGG